MNRPVSVAVLFADLSGSTRLYDKLGDQKALAIVERCLALFSAATVARGGRVVKTIGDEILAVFGDPHTACQAAVDMQLGLINLPECLEYAVSMHSGVHLGPVTIAEDGDVFGDTVNVAARLTSAAKRGQIVVSGEVLQSLGPEFAGQSRLLGSEALKGKDALVDLHELLWEPDAELTEMVQLRPTGPGAASSALSLTYLGRKFEVGTTHPILTIGRDPTSGIVTSDKLASRNHAKIEKTQEKFTYTDFSSNGTFLHLIGHDEALIRRDSLVLRSNGTISFGRPFQADAAAAIRFEIVTTRR